MKRSFAIAIFAIAAAARGDIYETPHNLLGAVAPTRGAPAPAGGQPLCVICHVPNQMQYSVQLAAWGGRGQNGALDVRADPAGPPRSLRWAGSTLRCLSCHAGTVSSINITFRPSSTSLLNEPANGQARALSLPGSGGLDPSGPVMGNHPVGVPYPLEFQAGTFRAIGPRAVTLGADWNPDPREKGLKLVADKSGFAVAAGSAGVECATCHDPHGTPNPYFLRLPLAGSQLCLGCHRK
jgi:predicted CXXCH cytochrome family protein